MVCKHCGTINPVDAEQCCYCGELLETSHHELVVSKTRTGILMALFLGVIGLIIGIFLYPSGSHERDSFVHAWIQTFFLALAVGLTVLIIIFISVT